MNPKTSCEECGLKSCDCIYLIPKEEDLSHIDHHSDSGYSRSSGFRREEDHLYDEIEELNFE